MSNQNNNSLNLFTRYLTIWVFFAITAGVLLGIYIPQLFQTLAKWQYANVNIVIAILIWVMIYPMMLQVDFKTIKEVKNHKKALFITLAINWLIKPFTMALLGVIFFKYIFNNFLPSQDAEQYLAGVILLGAAPCTAMVFVWSKLTKGNANYTLVQVALNDLILIIAFVPIVNLLLNVTDITIPWNTLLFSVLLYVLVPLAAGYVTREKLVKNNKIELLTKLQKKIEPFSMLGLLFTILILFALQAEYVVAKPIIFLLIAIPLIIQTYIIFAIAYLWSYLWKIPHNIAAPSALVGTSNFFELAVAVAIGIFGLNSGAALATVIGVLVEVPVMLSLVTFANKTNKFFIPQKHFVYAKNHITKS